MTEAQRKIGVLGGTGKLGNALARRWQASGHAIGIGSRDADRARDAAAAIGDAVAHGDMAAMAQWAEIIVIAVPFAAQEPTLLGIAAAAAGKIVIDATVPLMPPKVSRVQLPSEGSAAARAQALLGPEARVVTAFHNVPAHKLAIADEVVDCDVLVFGDREADRAVAVALAADAGLRGLHAGPLVNSAAAEALTSVLIFMNRHYRSEGTGIRITGID